MNFSLPLTSALWQKTKSFLKSPFFLFWVGISIPYLLWFLVFYPAFMSADSLYQWEQAKTLMMTNDHPYISILYLVPFERLTHSPGIVSLFQLLTTSALFAAGFALAWKKRVQKWIIILFAILAGLCIPIGVYNLTIWKDIPFSIALVALAFFIAKKSLDSDWSKFDIVFLIVLSIGSIFLRHNGLVYILFLPLLVFFCFKGKIRWLFPAILIPLFCFFQWILPTMMNVKDMDKDFRFSPLLLVNMNFYKEQPQAVITNETKIMLETVIPREDILKFISPVSLKWFYTSQHINWQFLRSDEFWRKLWHESWTYNIPQNMHFFLADGLNRFFVSTFGGGLIDYPFLDKNDFGFSTDSFFTFLREKGIFMLDGIKAIPQVRLLIWNAFIPFLTLLILFIDSIYKRKKHFLIFAGILLFQFPVMFLLNPSDNFRYFYFYLLAFFITIPLYLIKKEGKKIED